MVRWFLNVNTEQDLRLASSRGQSRKLITGMQDLPPNHDPAASDPEPFETELSEEVRPVSRSGGARCEPVIVFRNVSISFDGRAVLEDVSFSVDRGQTLCILGRSGVGKSVSLRMLMGFLKPDSGSIHVNGQEITDLDEEGMQQVRKRVTMVFQNGALFDSLSVRENVAFPLRERGGLEEDQVQQIVDRLIELVGADDVEDLLPASLSTGQAARRGHCAGACRAARGGACTTSRPRWWIP